jgi:hypothetical protein
MSVDLQGHVKHGVGYLCNMTIVLVNEVSNFVAVVVAVAVVPPGIT